MPGGVTTTSPSTFLPSPFEDEVSPQRGAQQHDDDDEHDSQRSPNSAVVPSTRCPRPESSTTDDATTKGEKECEEGRVADLIPDPASIFAPTLRTTTTTTTTATTTTTTTTTSSSLSTTSTGTATSGPDLDDRRGHSLDLPSSKGNGGKENSHHAGAKIRRSISELLHFGMN
ncbi:hypothetical protein B0F90DRAFT_1142551 [Multifurca ochricompacta]|uniref:Uncharacterized protein n=1 Tax=Multifurca ochricompacta TaxID=376703 RepID=A0AAD4LYL8_9AGAM|nr:hypothetical protein B0F90DRAFT_1142551 [Multifurca ochricompacta]